MLPSIRPFLFRTFILFSAMPGQRAIVNMASLSAHRAQPSHWNYSASKGAIVTLTKCMALDLAKDGIRVNSVSPGWIFTAEVNSPLSNSQLLYSLSLNCALNIQTDLIGLFHTFPRVVTK